ncbi:MAG TPA: hypothetical protein PLW09_09430 [Candidatus Kapabacteria bacterium]|nr:hypothetical protein [Candidatus Kapabacteria bacterium]
MAQLPDDTDAGGAKRGENSVDWQMLRLSADQVASGHFSVIGGGGDNSVAGNYSVIGGGGDNSVAGSYSVVSGGVSNRMDGYLSTIGGGYENFIGFDAEGGVITGGSFNQLGGNEWGSAASSILGGSNNELYGDYSTILGGQGLRLNGSGSFGFNANRFVTEPEEEYDRNMSVNASNTGIFNNIDLWLTNNDNTPRTLRFYESYNQEGTFPNGANYAAFQAAETMASDVTWTLPDADGSSGQVLSTNGSGLLSWANAGGGLQYFTESRNTTAPNDIVPVHQFAASGAETDIDIALTPKGNGALTAHTADGTNAGGNKRGVNAIDLQLTRVAASQVASGNYSTISGGFLNTASGAASSIGGGQQNTTGDDYAHVGGGSGNTATSMFTTVSGGEFNTANGIYAHVGGGYSNTASGNHSHIGGGQTNTASGQISVVSGGALNSAGGDYSAIAGGRGLTLDANADRSFGFHGNTAAGDRDMTIGAANTVVLGNVDLWLANNDNTTRSLRFYERYNVDGVFPNTANYVAFRAPNGIASDITWTLPDADGSSGQVLSTNGSGVLSWNTIALQYFTEARNTTAPNATRPVHQFAASGTGTDIDIALTPKGAGALTAQIADGTTTGGNKRGLGAVDWQMGRFDATQVASTGYSTIGGGLNNTASGDAATIAGGGSNTASGFMSFIGGGNANTAGGIVATVAGGVNNTATIGAHYSSIGGGNNNTTEGNGTTVSGGFDNTASGDYSTVLGGRGLTLSGSGSVGYLGNNTTGANDMVVTASNTAAFANVDLWIVNNDNTAHELRIYEASGSGSNYTAFRAADQAMDVTYTLPTGDGADGQMLTTNGAGQLSWRDAIPCGSIIMWTGDINNVPTGWALCDGTGGTPNLDDRFPRGTTNAASVGTTGGSDDHSHTVNDHDHTLSSVTASGTIDDGTVSGSIGTNTTGITASGTIDSGADITTDGANNYSSNVTIDITDSGHDHSFIGGLVTTSVSVNVSGSTDTASGVGTSSESNVPAYVYVGYIMKVCPVIP